MLTHFLSSLTAPAHTSDGSAVALLVPGRTREEVQVTYRDGYISVAAPAKESRGFYLPAIGRLFTCPPNLADSLTATLQDGVLYLNVTRPEPRAVPVSS